MFLGRMALAKVVDANLGRQKNDEGDIDCNVFTAKLKLFQKAEASLPSTLALREITNQEFEIINTNTSPLLVGEEIIVTQGPDERWFTLQKPHPRFQFVTTGKIVDRAVQVKVLRVQNAPPNLDTPGEILEYGDTLTIYDPFNLWSDIEEKATGWAYLAHQQEDITDTSEIDEQHVARYEIEECSLPVNEIKARLRDCLPGGMSTGTAIVDIGNQAIRSAYPNCDHPPEIPHPEEGAENNEVEVLFENTHKLDGIGGSPCVLRRITDRKVSDPENYLAPKPSSSTTAFWEVVQIDKKIARHVKVTFAPGFGWAGITYYDGFDTEEGEGENCEQTFSCPLCECDTVRSEEGDEGYAFLDTTAETVQYYVYSTKSAFYPKPKRHKILADLAETGSGDPLLRFDGNDCAIKHDIVFAELLCYEDPTEGTMPIPTQETTVTTCEGGSAEIRECVGTCLWQWSDAISDWDKVTPCTEVGDLGCDCSKPDIPSPPPSQGETRTSDCASPTGGAELCISLGTTIIKHIDCGGGSGGGGACEVVCIPLDPPTVGGGDCPNPCEAAATP